MTNHNSKLWRASLHMDRLNDRLPALTLLNEHAALLDRAISIVGSKPFLMDARRDGERMYFLSTDGNTAELVWSHCNSTDRPDRCKFPSFLLDLDDGALNEWRDRQSGMLAAVVPGKAAE